MTRVGLKTRDIPYPPSPQGHLENPKGCLIMPEGCKLAVHNVHPTDSLPTSFDVMDEAFSAIQEANPELMPISAVFELSYFYKGLTEVSKKLKIAKTS